MHRCSLLAASLCLVLLSSLTLAQVGKLGGRQHNFNHLLKRLDKNGDGQISRDEWAGKPKAFDRLDANHDGVITRAEAEAAFQNRAEKRSHAAQAFKVMDKNNDGKISRDEWTGKPKAFDRLDTNRDGVLTPDELRARHRQGTPPTTPPSNTTKPPTTP